MALLAGAAVGIFVAAAVGVAMAAIAVFGFSGVGADAPGFTGATPLPCETFKPDAAAWRVHYDTDFLDPEVASQQVATVLHCRLVIGATRREIDALLGPEEPPTLMNETPRLGLWAAGTVGVDVHFNERGIADDATLWEAPGE